MPIYFIRYVCSLIAVIVWYFSFTNVLWIFCPYSQYSLSNILLLLMVTGFCIMWLYSFTMDLYDKILLLIIDSSKVRL